MSKTLTFTEASLAMALGNVKALHEMSVELISECVFAALESQQAASVGGEREAFEAAYAGRCNFERNPHHPDIYAHEPCRARWDSWMARAALSPAGGGVAVNDFAELSKEAASTVRGMVEYCLNQRVCLGMDEGFKSFEPEVEHDFVKELHAFAQANSQEGAK